jgi:hypothetical protein
LLQALLHLQLQPSILGTQPRKLSNVCLLPLLLLLLLLLLCTAHAPIKPWSGNHGLQAVADHECCAWPRCKLRLPPRVCLQLCLVLWQPAAGPEGVDMAT